MSNQIKVNQIRRFVGMQDDYLSRFVILVIPSKLSTKME